MKNLGIWLLYFIPALVVEIFCYLTNPIVALFVIRELRTDRVKREPFNNGTYIFDREYLIRTFRWWQTHDNAVDEWWYGAFNLKSHFRFLREATQQDYDNSWWIRYCCRVMWMYRNNAYGFMYNFFSRPLEFDPKLYEHGIEDSGEFWYLLAVYPSSFKLEVQIPLWANKFTSANMGFKPHKGFSRLMYANRLPFSNIREYK